MFCKKLNCTLSIEMCIKRQNICIPKEKDRELAASFQICNDCKTGKKIKENPNRYINRDVLQLMKKYAKENDIPEEHINFDLNKFKTNGEEQNEQPIKSKRKVLKARKPPVWKRVNRPTHKQWDYTGIKSNIPTPPRSGTAVRLHLRTIGDVENRRRKRFFDG